MAEPPVRFAGMLRQLRAGAALTQEELAEAAGLNSRTVSDLERGLATTPHKDTVRLLADALQLSGSARVDFEAVARGHAVPGQARGRSVAAATRTLPRDIASFTGRQHELAELADAAAGAGGVVSIHAIGGMAGIGKTAFAVHAAHRLAGRFPGGQIFLPLHGHTPGQQPVGPADALASLLLTIGVPAGQIPADLQARTGLWRDRLAGRQFLLVLDDAAGSEQVRPLLPGAGGSLVLITSRRRLTALEDAQTISLDALPPGEAAGLLVRLAVRPGLSPADPAVREITRLCGCLPLAIGMLARQLYHHPAWTWPGWPPSWPPPRAGWSCWSPRTCRSPPRSTYRMRTWPRTSSGCSAGSRCTPAPTSTRTPPPLSTAPAWTRPAAAWTPCMTSTCSPSPPRAGTGCTT